MSASYVVGANRKVDETVAREEHQWDKIYLDMNVDSPLKIISRDQEMKPHFVFIHNDWKRRLQSYLSEASGIEATFQPRANPRDSLSRIHKLAGSDTHACVERPSGNYMIATEMGLQSYGGSDSYFGTNLEGGQPDVEYDMDEFDSAWLELSNLDRVSKGLKRISEDTFELLMDRFERAWYTLSRAAQRWTSRRIESKCADDLRCDICGDGETAVVNNLIVICESCDVAVHQDCYGVPLIPEGPWLCRKCYLEGPVVTDCALCPWKEGALKPTTDPSRPWCHLLCAQMLGHEVHILNPTYKEPVGIFGIHPERWNLVCQVCKLRSGAPTQCSLKSCHAALHPKCARKAGCLFDQSEQTLKCWKHSQLEIQSSSSTVDTPPQRSIASPAFEPADIQRGFIGNADEGGRGKKLFQNPTIPKTVIENLFYLILDIPERQRIAAIESVARFWSLKRSRRHGTPLIKSLQIEPWTSGGVLSNVHAALQQRRSLLFELKQLELVTGLLYQIEKRRLGSILADSEILEIALHPLNTILLTLCNQLGNIDSFHFFAEPVSAQLVPDYYDIIKNPMDLSSIEHKITTGQYDNFKAFLDDVHLIYSNAIIYNSLDTVYYAEAVKFIEKAKPLLETASGLLKRLGISRASDVWQSPLEIFLPTQSKPPLPQSKKKRDVKEADIKSVSQAKERSGRRRDTQEGLVWAKLKGYPYYPARIIRIKDLSIKEKLSIPKNILQAAKEANTSKALIQFFDKEEAYGLVPLKALHRLGQNFDQDFNNIVRVGKSKVSLTTEQDLRRAFKAALEYSKKLAKL